MNFQTLLTVLQDGAIILGTVSAFATTIGNLAFLPDSVKKAALTIGVDLAAIVALFQQKK
jgi:hypothetical protein